VAAVSISDRQRERAVGELKINRRMEPNAVPVVSAPACMRSVTWARFWSGLKGSPEEKRASRQLSTGQYIRQCRTHCRHGTGAGNQRLTHCCRKSGLLPESPRLASASRLVT
jgi:hypothetical protein